MALTNRFTMTCYVSSLDALEERNTLIRPKICQTIIWVINVTSLIPNNYVLNGVSLTIKSNEDDCLNEDCLNQMT